MLYTLKKQGAYYTVQTQSGVVQFRSLRKCFCVDWIADNTPSADNTQEYARTIDTPQKQPQLSHATINAARRIQSHATKAERFTALSNQLREELSC